MNGKGKELGLLPSSPIRLDSIRIIRLPKVNISRSQKPEAITITRSQKPEAITRSQKLSSEAISHHQKPEARSHHQKP